MRCDLLLELCRRLLRTHRGLLEAAKRLCYLVQSQTDITHGPTVVLGSGDFFHVTVQMMRAVEILGVLGDLTRS